MNFNTKKILTVAALSTLTCVIANAQPVDNRANIYVGGFNYRFDDERNLKNDGGYLLGGELPISKRWSLALEYWNVDTEHSNISGELNYSRLGTNYHLGQIKNWQPYLSAGVANARYASGLSYEETPFDFGLGTKYYFTDNFMMRADMKTILGFESSHAVDFALSIGLGYVFGSKKSSSGRDIPVTRFLLSSTVTPAQKPAEPMDSDKDGIVDSRDNCPRTPVEIMVNKQGCPVLETTMMEQTLEVEFDTNKAEIKPEYNTTIKYFADFMKLYPDTKAIIEGHTDSIGSVVNNLSLSKRRAMAIVNELVNVYSINIARLTAAGLGELSPISPNNTAAGRSQNRRIEAHISIEVKEEQMR